MCRSGTCGGGDSCWHAHSHAMKKSGEVLELSRCCEEMKEVVAEQTIEEQEHGE